MRPIKLFTDSTSDLTKELYESIDCKVLPLGVSFGERHFVDGVDIDTKKIYELVKETGTLPKTNAVNINVFEENFKKCLDEGNDIVFVPISSNFSSNFSTANMVAIQLGEENEEYKDRIQVIDSRSLSSGIGLQLFSIYDDIKAGYSLTEIAERAKDRVDRVNAEFVVDTMEYLYKGGRCSGLSYFFGKSFHLHPVIRVEHGKMIVHKITRGKKIKGVDFQISEFLEQLKNDNVELSHIFITHSLVEGDDKYMYDIVTKYVDPSIVQITVAGSIVASHCGPGTIGLLYITKTKVIK